MTVALQPHSDEVIEEHYTNLASKYDEFLKYSPDFIRRMTVKMIDKLGVGPDDRFVDLGGGTGIYSADILNQIDFHESILLVDPFEEMLAQAPDHPKLTLIKMDALSFSARQGVYDKILIKETIHHIRDRRTLFRNLFERLTPGGRLLLVHVPPEIDYPLFEAAIERSRRWHADPLGLIDDLEGVGFAVDRDRLDYPHRLPKEIYIRMVKGCYMSLLTSFTEDELLAGLAEMAAKYRDQDILSFVDRFDFITGSKP
ncbi:MAG: methyltransferase domain-containing protein [Alphaproteobacteria bacterium]